MALASTDARDFLFPKTSPHVHDPAPGAQAAARRLRFGFGGELLKGDALRDKVVVGENNGGSPPHPSFQESQPYFERVDAAESLRMELEETRRLLGAAKDRQRNLERMNADIERRLEAEAMHRMEVEAELAKCMVSAAEEKRAHIEEMREAEIRHSKLKRLDAFHKNQIGRLERDLYRMHQRKYDMEKTWRARREEASQSSKSHRHEEVVERLKREEELRNRRQREEESIAAAVIQRRSGLTKRIKQQSLVSNMRNFFGLK